MCQIVFCHNFTYLFFLSGSVFYLGKLNVKVPSRLQHDYSLETPKKKAGKCIGRILKVLSKQIVIFRPEQVGEFPYHSQTMTNECTIEKVEIKVPFIARYITFNNF